MLVATQLLYLRENVMKVKVVTANILLFLLQNPVFMNTSQRPHLGPWKGICGSEQLWFILVNHLPLYLWVIPYRSDYFDISLLINKQTSEHEQKKTSLRKKNLHNHSFWTEKSLILPLPVTSWILFYLAFQISAPVSMKIPLKSLSV